MGSEANGHTLAIAPRRRGRPPKMVATKKIAIVGKAPSSRLAAPYDDESWEIWGLADLYNVIPRWSRWFELHEVESRREKWQQAGYLDWLRQDHGRPIYMRARSDEFPSSVPYPKDRVIAAMALTHSVGEQSGTNGQPLPYFTNQVSWMIAFAMLEGATHIGLWGVDMAQHGDGVKSEYAYQRPSCEYFLGVAAGRGIVTTVHEHSDILKSRLLYGFDADTNAMRLKWKARFAELSQQLEEARANIQQQQFRRGVIQGHIDELTSWPEGEARQQREAKWLLEMNGGKKESGEPVPGIVPTLDYLVKREHVLLGAIDDMNYWREWSE